MNKLLTKYLSSVAVFDTPNDKGNLEPKSPTAQEQRDAIKVEVSSSDQDNPDNKDDGDDKDDDEDDEKEEDDPKPDETAEQKTARIASEKEERRQGRIQKRIDKLTATVGNKDTEIAELKKQLAEKPVEGLTEEEVERRANEKAEKLAADKESERELRVFQKTAEDLIKAGNKLDKEFEKNINEVAKETGILMPKYMVEILSDLDNDNGDEILVSLSKDEDLYEEICVLSERKMTQRLIRMSDKIKEDKGKSGKENKPNKERERLPNPIEPINDGSNNRGNTLPSKPTENMTDFVRIRSEQVAQRRKEKFGY